MSTVIGIGGISRSGKTTLANQLGQLLNAPVLHQDQFNASPLPEINGHVDWETPAAVDYPRLITAIQEAGNQSDHVIVEGILIYASPKLNSLFDKRLVLTLTENEFKRRKSRDLRWGKEPDWYIHHIWTGFIRYGYPPDGAYIQLDGISLPGADEVKELLDM